MELSVIIPVMGEIDAVAKLIPSLVKATQELTPCSEILLINQASETNINAHRLPEAVTCLQLPELTYSKALKWGVAQAKGDYVLFIDPDLASLPTCLADMWRVRCQAGLIIGSRYTPGGHTNSSFLRKNLSFLLNIFLRRALSVSINDFSSGLRLFPRRLFNKFDLSSTGFDILLEQIVKTYASGWQIIEIPFQHSTVPESRFRLQALRVGLAFTKTIYRMWRLRNSVNTADYDERAFNSIIPLQRYWQRTRHRIITQFATKTGPILDIGCGSSRILRDLPGAVGLDIQFSKLRFMTRYNLPLNTGSIFHLPYGDELFQCVVCSEVIEHIIHSPQQFSEMHRILKKGGTLVLGTPDYSTLLWPPIEKLYGLLAPDGYADEHITHYTQSSLMELLDQNGFTVEKVKYVFWSEMIMQCTKR